MSGYPLEPLLDQLRDLADEKYRLFNESLMPGAEGTSIGVRMPALRKVAREIMKTDPAGFLQTSLGSEIHEINLLHAIVLAQADLTAKERIDLIRRFVPTISNWAVCDLFCHDLKPSAELSGMLLPLLREYAVSSHEYEVRTSLVLLMTYYRDAAHIDETLQLYSLFHHDGYYAKMAAAWGLSFLYVDWPERTVALLKNHTFDCFTHNKAIQKCIESYRVSDADKQMLRALRR